MRNFSMTDNKPFISGSINDEYTIGSNWYPADMVSQVKDALCASMEIMQGQMDLALGEISRQGRLDSGGDYEMFSNDHFLTPAEYRVLANFWLFYLELEARYTYQDIESVFHPGETVRLEMQEYGAQTFVYINMNTGARVVWTHICN